MERPLGSGMRMFVGLIGMAAIAAGLMVGIPAVRQLARESPMVPTAVLVVVAGLVIVGGTTLIRGAVRGRIAVRRPRR
jgi:hypothetical protein